MRRTIACGLVLLAFTVGGQRFARSSAQSKSADPPPLKIEVMSTVEGIAVSVGASPLTKIQPCPRPVMRTWGTSSTTTTTSPSSSTGSTRHPFQSLSPPRVIESGV